MLDKALEIIRIGLYAALVAVGLFLYQAWEKDHPPVTAASTAPTQTAVNANRYVPTPATAAAATTTAVQSAATGDLTPPSSAGALVTVKTDVMTLTLDTQGGDVVGSNLPQYPETLGSSVPYTLLTNDPATRYIAESGLLGQDGPDTSDAQAIYKVEDTNYTLAPGQNTLTVNMTWTKHNITVVKSFVFTRGSYAVKVHYDIINESSAAWQGNLYTQLVRTNTPPVNHSGMMNLATYFGAAISSEQKPYEKISFKQMQEKNVDVSIQNGWAAMIQHYFISAWIPPKDAVSNYYSRVSSNGLYTIGMIGSPLNVAPGQKASFDTTLYTGPALADQLSATAPGLQLTIDYGWLWFISVIIFWMMQHIYDVIGNWGWSIVLVTVIIKAMFYGLSAKSYRSMSLMKRLQPKMEALKQKFGDDRQKLTQATLELYREEKVNPMSGCLPILIQIPVFIALYWVLVESVQLRQAPFILWIHDLSAKDPYYVLPVLMGISMFIQQRLNPPAPDPMQAKVMMLMPVVFTVLFANFPSGLMLYWFVNNTLSFLQQWHILRKIEKEYAHKKK